MATKKCKYCKQEIDKAATVCPYCQKNQGLSCGGAIVALVLIFGVGGFCITSCRKTEERKQNPNPAQTTASSSAAQESPAERPATEQPAAGEYGSYQEILDDYTTKLQAATPVLIEEYNKEAADNDKGLTGLAEICNNKIMDLAKISNDGTMEMANYYHKHGSGSYSEYEEWAVKMSEAYQAEAAKIQEVYQESAK